MQQRQLGSNGPMISPIGIGATSFTNFYGRPMKQSHTPYWQPRWMKVSPILLRLMSMVRMFLKQ